MQHGAGGQAALCFSARARIPHGHGLFFNPGQLIGSALGQREQAHQFDICAGLFKLAQQGLRGHGRRRTGP